MSNYSKAIFDKLFLPEGKRFVVAVNPDGWLLSEDCRSALSEFGVRVYHGSSISLRIVRETIARNNPGSLILFVKSGDFEELPDIGKECDLVNLQFSSFFPRYPWDKVKWLPFEKQAWLFDQEGLVNLDALFKNDGTKSVDTALYEIPAERWNLTGTEIDFDRPSEWMCRAGETVLALIEQNRWKDAREQVRSVNDRFLAFLREGYVNIAFSTCGSARPRTVSQVLPFISRQPEEKTALVVVDGMNWWQALMLTKCIGRQLGTRCHYDCIYSWIPSVTELSRQAIFRGDIPLSGQNYGPGNEKQLWKAFWESRGFASHELHYQHSGFLDLAPSIRRVGYVDVELDGMMHASRDYRYLFSSTRIWLDEGDLIANIRQLSNRGFRIFITSDHGNVETTAYKRLEAREKLGADLSLRHITLPQDADRKCFEKAHQGHVIRLDEDSRTYFACGNEAFMNEGRCVTHGGIHWLEVLIPFITLHE